MRSGYKLTEVGEIPSDWEVVTLGSIASIRDGTHQTPRYVAAGVPFYSVEHVTSRDFSRAKFITEEEHRFLTRSYKIEKGDVLMTRIGSIGDCVLVDWDVEASFYVSLALLKIYGADAAYVAAYSELPAFKNEIDRHALSWATPKKINLGAISNVRLALPSDTKEQRAIAGALHDFDALLTSLDNLIAKKRDIKQAAMQQLLTGKTRLLGFHGEWKPMCLGDLATLKSGESITSTRIGDVGEYPCYGGNGLRGFTNTFTHDGEYALIGRQGALCGNVSAAVGKFFASEHAIVVSAFPGVDIQWLRVVLHEANLNKYSESSAQPGLSVGKLLTLRFVVPQTKSEQTAIAAVLSDIEKGLAALEARRDKTRAIKQAMMQELLTGKTRVSSPELAYA